MSINLPFVSGKVENTINEEELVNLDSAKSAILIEATSGQILYEKNAHEKLAPASMTKIMTMKLVLDAIEDNNLSFDKMLTTSTHASKMGGSQIFLAENEQMKCIDLFKSMVIASANDAAVVLAEEVSGSEDNFVRKMNLEANKIGCKNTNFVNCTGLPVENHYTTSYDMALMARNLLINYEDTIIPFSSTYEDYVRKDTSNPFWLVNTNKMLKMNNGIDGLKTGWTNDAGYCITTTMKKDGMRLISVVMGAESPTLRNNDTLKLLNYGYTEYELIPLKGKNEEVTYESDIVLSPNKYHIVTSEEVNYIKRKDVKLGDVTYDINLNRDKIRKLCREEVGELFIYIDNELYTKVNLELKEKPAKATFIEIVFEVFKSLFK